MKKSIGKRTLLYTHPVFVVGSYDSEGKPNLITISWGGICCSDPPCVAISLRESRHSFDSIIHNQAFTVNIPSVRNIEEADYAGTYSGKNCNKFEDLNLTPVSSETVNAPFVMEFPVNLICRVIKVVEIGIHVQIIGEIVDVLADEEVIGDKGLPEIEKVMPFIYDSGSRFYYSIGEKLERAYSAKKK
jgi:flavin reductase (DIM6/NTAB) family NADH-FMN oxidoreductase RutF